MPIYSDYLCPKCEIHMICKFNIFDRVVIYCPKCKYILGGDTDD
jgi:Zn-finger nucleic acid-binding protein